MIRYRYFFALALLVMSLVLTSGATATAMELLQTGEEATCCDTADNDATPFDTPCSEPGCQCISCLTFVVPMSSHRKVLIAFLAVSVFSHHEKLPPLEYYKSIDYPPEFS